MAGYREHILRNRKLPCSVDGCAKLRAWSSNLCKAHSNVKQRWGSPCGRVLDPRKDYPTEMGYANELLRLNANSEPVLVGVKWLQNLIESAYTNQLYFKFEPLRKKLAGDTYYKLQLGPDVYSIQWMVLPRLVGLTVLLSDPFKNAKVQNFDREWMIRMYGHSLLQSGRKLPKPKYTIKHCHLPACYKEAGELIQRNLSPLLGTLSWGTEKHVKKIEEREKLFLNKDLIVTDPEEVPLPPDPEEPTPGIRI